MIETHEKSNKKAPAGAFKNMLYRQD